MTELTHALLTTLLYYSPETGNFIWQDRPGMRGCNAHRTGTSAGSLYSNGYVYITIYKKRYLRSRLAYFYKKQKWPKKDIDHENTIKNDDRWTNLRLARESQNIANSKLRSDNRSGFKGVGKVNNRWRAKICVNQRKINLGYYKSPEEAHAAYCAAAVKYFGKFARFG